MTIAVNPFPKFKKKLIQIFRIFLFQAKFIFECLVSEPGPFNLVCWIVQVHTYVCQFQAFHSIAKCVAALTVMSPNEATNVVNQFVNDVKV